MRDFDLVLNGETIETIW
jgi:hypothetical protein